MTDKQNHSRVHYIHRLSVAVQQRIVGIFVLVAVLVIAGLVLLQIRSSYILDDRIVYDTYLTNAQGISTDTRVNISGIDVGKVESIDITDDNKVHVRLFVYDRFQRLVRSDSTAELSKLSVIGNAVIIIQAGSHQLPILPAGSTIFTEEPVTIDELIARLTPAVTNLNSIVEKIAVLIDVIDPDQLQATTSDVSAIVRNLRDVSEQINQGQGVIGRLTHDRQLEDQVATMVSDLGGMAGALRPAASRVDPLMRDARQLVATLNANMQQLQGLLSQTEQRIRQVGAVLEPAEQLMNRSNLIAEDVKATSGVVSQEIRHLPDMIDKMQNLLDSTNRTIENAQQVWPLSTVIPPTDSETRIAPQPLDD